MAGLEGAPQPEVGPEPEARPLRLIYPFEVPVLVFVLIGIALADRHGFRIAWGLLGDFSNDLLMLRELGRYSLLALLFVYGKRRFYDHQERAEILTDLWAAVRVQAAPYRDWRRWVEVARVLLAIKLCLCLYSSLKQAIPLMNPVLYDDQFWAIDRWLHLGHSPVHTSLSWFSAPVFSRPIDGLYVFWYTVKMPFLVYFVFFAAQRRCWRFLTAYFLLWMAGVFFAIAWPSVGPIYTNPELFSELAKPFADTLQAPLWADYQALLADPAAYQFKLYEGVAAFPSLHVGFMALFAISVREVRWIFWPMVIFWGLIQLGSVLLGWHYAVDGYAGSLIGVALWFALGLVIRDLPQPDPEEPTPTPEEPTPTPEEPL